MSEPKGIPLNPAGLLYQEVVDEVGRRLRAEWVAIGEIGSEGRLTVSAHWSAEEKEIPAVLELADGPAADALSGRVCFIPEDARQKHPDDPLLALAPTEAFLAVPLVGAARQPLGVMAVAVSRPLPTETVDDLVLHALALRAATELERQRSATEVETYRARLSQFLRQMPQVVIYETSDTDPGREFVSENIVDLLGHPADEFTNDRRFFQSLRHPDDNDRVHEAFRQWRLDGRPKALTIEYRMRRADGREIWLEDHAVEVVGPDGSPYVSGVLIDVTERKGAEQELRRRAEFEELVSSISTRFIDLRHEDLEEAVSASLAALGEFTAADRTFVVMLTDGGETLSLTHEWVAAGSTPNIGKYLNLPISGFPWTMEVMAREKVLPIASLDELPDEASAERQILEEAGVVACLNAPMVADGRTLGFIATATDTEPRKWTGEESSLLRIVAEVVSGALARHYAETELRTSEERLRLATGQVPAVIWTTDTELRFVTVSGTGMTAVGLDPDDVIGIPLDEMLADETEAHAVQAHHEALEGKSGRYEQMYRDRLFEAQVEPLRDRSGNIIGVIGIGLDVTESKHEARLREALFNISEATGETESLEDLLQIIHVQVAALLEADNFTVALYDAAKEIYTFPYSIDQGDPVYPSEADRLEGSITDYIRRTATPALIDLAEHNRLEKSGEIQLVGSPSKVWMGSPLRAGGDAFGVVFVQSYEREDAYDEDDLAVLSFVADHIALSIQRKIGEEALRASEEKYRSLFSTETDGVVIVDAETESIVDANEAALSMYGYEREEFIGLGLTEINAETEQAGKHVRLAARGEQVPLMTTRHRRKDGSIFPLEVSTGTFVLDERRVVFGIMRDITDREAAQRRLRMQAEAQELAAEISQVLIDIDPDGLDLAVHDALGRLGGHAAADRVYVFLYSEDGATMSNTHEWCGEGVDEQAADLQDLPVDAFTWWQAQVEEEEVILVPDVSALPAAAAAEKAEWEREGIKSLVCVPMVRRGRLIGFVGCDNVRQAGPWPDHAVTALRLVAGVLAATLGRHTAEERLLQQVAAIEGAMDGMALLDDDGKYLYLNNAHAEVYGYESQSELMGKTWKELYKGDELLRFEEEIMPRLFAEGSWRGEARGLRKDGTEFPQEVSLTLLESGGLVCVIRDVSSRIEAEAALRSSEERLSLALSGTHDGIWDWDLVEDELYRSPRWKSMIGLPEDTEADRLEDWIERIHPDDADGAIRSLTSHLEGATDHYVSEHRILHQAGHYVWVLDRGEAVRDRDGLPYRMVGSHADITKRKRAEEALRQSEELYRLITENATDLIAKHAADGTFSFVSPACQTLLGYEPEEMVGVPMRDFVHEEDVVVLSGCLADLSRGKSSCTVAYRIRMKSGEFAWLETTSTAVRDPDGTLVEVVAVSRDITDRMRAEQALRESEQRMASLFEHSPFGIEAYDAEGNLMRINEAARRIFGVAEQSPEYNLFDSPFVVDEIKEALTGGQSYRSELVFRPENAAFATRKREMVWTDTSIFPSFDDHGEVMGYFALYEDVTASRHAERALQQSEEKHRVLLNSIRSPAIALTSEMKILYTNRAFAELADASADGLEGVDLLTSLPAWGEGPSAATYEQVMASGREASVEVSHGGLHFLEHVFPTPDGGVLAIRDDITDRKRFERELLEARDAALEASRLKSEFLANISHEVRTPLNGVIGMTKLALDTRLNEEQREYLDLVLGSAETLLAVINDILDLSKIEAGRLDLESIEFGLRAELERLRAIYDLRAREKGLALSWDIPDPVPEALRGDPVRLGQVLNNLLSNALKFTEKGSFGLAVGVDARDEGQALVRFTVADSGIGIEPEKQEIIFDTFSQADGSTARKYGGTGLGLSIAAQIVGMMGGEIGVESTPGEGSSFWFTARFPYADAEEASPALAPALPEEHPYMTGRRRLTLLLAEDNMVNRKLARSLLEKRGHKVLVAADGREALEVLEKTSVDVVLMDVQMPEMDGFEATAAIREREAGAGGHLPIVALTAHAMKGAREKCLEAGMDGYVAKPLTTETMFAEIARVTPEGAGLEVDSPPVSPAAPDEPEEPADDGRPVDTERLIARVEGDTELLREVIEIFLEEHGPILAQIGSAIDAGDTGGAARLAHMMKGSVSNFAARDAHQAAKDLEAAARTGDLDEAGLLFSRLEAELARVKSALEALVEGGVA